MLLLGLVLGLVSVWQSPSRPRARCNNRARCCIMKGLQEPCNVVLTHTNADFDSLASAVAVAKVWNVEHPEHPTHVVMPRGSNPLVSRFLAYHKHLLPLRGYATIQADDLQRVGVVDTSVARPRRIHPSGPHPTCHSTRPLPAHHSPPQPSRHPPEAATQLGHPPRPHHHLDPTTTATTHLDLDHPPRACTHRRQSRNRLGPAEKWLANASHIVVYDHHVEVNGDINPDELVLDDVGSLTTVLAARALRSPSTSPSPNPCPSPDHGARSTHRARGAGH